MDPVAAFRRHRGRRFDGCVVAITGASAGVGRATALAFAREGAKVALLARGAEGLHGASEQVRALGADALCISLDVADAAALDHAAEEIEQKFGPIDIWVNNAMATVFAPLSEMEPAEFRRVTEVTYLGSVYGTMAALKRMRPRDRGMIVQVSSALAYRSIPLQSAYCGAKHAIAGYLDSLRSELDHERSRIRLTSVQLPAINTPQFSWARNKLPSRPQPVPPIFAPEVAARAILWAARHRRRTLPVGGPTLLALWAQKVAPGLLDRYLARTAYRGQQTAQRDVPPRPDNLFAPLQRDHGVHGQFRSREHRYSAALWASEYRTPLLTLAAGVVGAAGAAWLRRRYAFGFRKRAQRALHALRRNVQ